ncbi:alpha/beta fold hydrolase [Caenimonas aquaedulcis]|uniref:Alpha/beta fold hydrolase n=1 Tax=Caenimonas aquaedulcis TaxID=2793270 RepID=A0A931H6Q1_9BURK|nr:alpha/beta fold hydrolase [Caenimonas aquaedulcis]MBG9389548.1 alpha/beta fold hydrolase [Caenimonas aquaedulcis]
MTQLVLIPGLAGDATMWRAQIAGLHDWRPVVTDVQMHHTSIESMASGLLAAHAGPLMLCGASMGGMIAMEAARQAPQRVAGLALLGTSARPESPDMRKLRETACELFAQGRAAEVIEPNVRFAFHPDQAADPELTSTYVEFVLRAGAEQLIRQNRAVMARPDARPHLPAVRCPTLVMCGDRDQLTPPENSHEIATLVPGARLVQVSRCGHMLTMEKPDEVNAALRGWLTRVRDSAPSP